jgi:hypothetical protein
MVAAIYRLAGTGASLFKATGARYAIQAEHAQSNDGAHG